MKNNYFLLYHSMDYKQGDIKLLLNETSEDFDEIAAFFLSLSLERLEYFLVYDAFKKLSKKVIINGFLDASTLFEFSFLALQRVEKNPHLVTKYLKVFAYLASVELMTQREKDNLYTIFEALLVERKKQVIESDNYLDAKKFMKSSLLKVRENCESKKSIDAVDLLVNSLDKKNFSIGITGVMNVGKSSFINALLGKKILGSSVVAETASLSILKYSKEPYAKVSFLNRLEFDELSHTREKSISVDAQAYIKNKSLVIDVLQNELQRYTSAKDPLSEIVKNVEIGVDLEFLQDSIEIVDTPGLDDTLIMRETITKTYMESCDLLIHLMNVNQSATQKDVDFLVDSANKDNLSAILILLTKVDNITNDELAQVMSYTKKTILSQLNTQIPIEFLSISASTKLGIDKVKDYLYHTLFDSNIKNKSLLNNARLKLKKIIQEQIDTYTYVLLLYSKDEEALEKELREFNNIKETNKLSIQKINLKIDAEFKAYKIYVSHLDADFESEVLALKEKLLIRILDELSYTLKNKVKVKQRQVLMLIDKSISHGYIDIIREYKYKLKEYMLGILKKIELSFQHYKIEGGALSDEDSMSKLFEKNSNSSLNTSIKMISKRVNYLLDDVKISKLEKLKGDLLDIIDEEFEYISKNLYATKDALNEQTAKEFFSSLKEPIDKLSLEMTEQEQLLASQIYALQNSDEDLEGKRIEILRKINSLNVILGNF